MLETVGVAVEFVDLSGVENFLVALADHLRLSSAKVIGDYRRVPRGVNRYDSRHERLAAGGRARRFRLHLNHHLPGYAVLY